MNISKVVIGRIDLSKMDKSDEEVKREKFSKEVGDILDKGIEWLGVRAKLPRKVN